MPILVKKEVSVPLVFEREKYYSTQEISKVLNLTDQTVRKLMREGNLPSRKIGRTYHVSLSSLHKYISGKEAPKKRGRPPKFDSLYD